MSRRTTAWWRSDLTYAERLCDGGLVRSSSRSRSPSTFMVVAFILNLYQNECAKQAVIPARRPPPPARRALEEARELLASTRGPARRGAAERLAEVAARLDPGAAEPDAPPAIRFTPPPPPPPPPPEPELPPAPPARLEVPVTLAVDVSGLDVLGDPPGSPADAALALMATALADAESFDRLLALERAVGLLRLSHQEETARKVLTLFLGRALLADEVGLGICQARRAAREASAFDRTPWMSHLSRERASAIASSS